MLDKLTYKDKLEIKLDKLQNKYRASKRFLKNVYLWYPILISDEQWDGGYVYDVLNHKLKLMEDFFRSDKTNTLHILKYADEIKKARVILDRLIEDDYMTEEATAYYSDINIEDRFKNKKPMSEDTRKDIMRWFKEEAEAIDKDKKDLFDLLYKKLDGWWD